MSDGPESLRARLLARHAAATPQLDALRRAALPPALAPVPATAWSTLLRELFFPHRRAWGALAAVWLGLTVFHFTLGRAPRPAPSPDIPPAAFAAWLNQHKSYDAFAQIDVRR